MSRPKGDGQAERRRQQEEQRRQQEQAENEARRFRDEVCRNIAKELRVQPRSMDAEVAKLRAKFASKMGNKSLAYYWDSHNRDCYRLHVDAVREERRQEIAAGN